MQFHLNGSSSVAKNRGKTFKVIDKPIDHIRSPALDVLHFFGGSLVNDVYHNREVVLCEYHSTLTSTMAELECDTEVLSLDELRDTLKKRVFFEVCTTVAFLAGRVIQQGKEIERPVADLSTDYTNPAHSEKLFKQIMIRRLSLFDSKRLLDV